MTTPVRIATTAAVGVLAVAGTLLVLSGPGQTGVGGTGPSPTPVASGAPSTAPTAAASSPGSSAPSNGGSLALPDGPIAAGTYRGEVVVPRAGAWDVQVSLALGRFDNPVTTVRVTVRP